MERSLDNAQKGPEILT